ncbi:MAG: SDR family NAD(P)-dependent oxidoreductase [Spirochaetales bacterium]|uniref:SDR family NAD(P)-dependent oxidoreductase n=1 Tax=Candidatus Thalassospirochaeta sargassi TaxID=3119039 RepID=A0AAJ1MJK5_9SPIO|nr:SDR family NAD(P)-dependent oxidoreductase [Spirochaetales bacterium]
MKTILITGSTDGIGLETAKMLTAIGQKVLLHGRKPEKLERVMQELSCDGFIADLSRLKSAVELADAVEKKYQRIDVLINNAGVFSTEFPRTAEGLDARFAVNTIAPYLLTKRLLPLLGTTGRVVSLSSAAQSTVSLDALKGNTLNLTAGSAYAQSKLALTMWSNHLAAQLGKKGPVLAAVNPGSMLGSKMVKEAYGVVGGDIKIGADILTRAAVSAEFDDASGRYFDNDRGIFASPHPDALDSQLNAQVVEVIEGILAKAGIQQAGK